MLRNTVIGGGIVVFTLILPIGARAQLNEHLAAYTGSNAKGYLKPLVDAFAADLNAGLFHSAYIPDDGLHVRFEVRGMSVFFRESDRTFTASTEEGFRPQLHVPAPTIVGSRTAPIYQGAGNTEFAFPGGFDLQSFSFGVPQIRIGSEFGTEVVARYAFYRTSTANLGDLSLYGAGARHSISQYLGSSFPLDVAASFFWQDFSLGRNSRGQDFVDAKSTSLGLHIGKRYRALQLLGGVSYDTFSMDVSYELDDASEIVDIDFEREATVHYSVGFALGYRFMDFHGEYNKSAQNAFSIGLGFNLIGN